MKILSIPISRGYKKIFNKDIIRIEGASNYCKIFIKGNERPFIASKVLRWFEDSLSGYAFIRVHKSHLVNFLFINPLENIYCNKMVLKNGESILISRRKRNNVLKTLDSFINLMDEN